METSVDWNGGTSSQLSEPVGSAGKAGEVLDITWNGGESSRIEPTGSLKPEDQVMGPGELPFGEYCTQERIAKDYIEVALQSGDLNEYGRAIDAHSELLQANRASEHARLMQVEFARRALEESGVTAL